MKWSHVAAIAVGLLIAAGFGWTGDTQPSRLATMTSLDALGAAVLVFGLFLLAWYNFWLTMIRQRRSNIHVVDYDAPLPGDEER